MVVPSDPTVRLRYWPQRSMRGGDSLAPGERGRLHADRRRAGPRRLHAEVRGKREARSHNVAGHAKPMLARLLSGVR